MPSTCTLPAVLSALVQLSPATVVDFITAMAKFIPVTLRPMSSVPSPAKAVMLEPPRVITLTVTALPSDRCSIWPVDELTAKSPCTLTKPSKFRSMCASTSL